MYNAFVARKRFRTDRPLSPGAVVEAPSEEARHAAARRVKPGEAVELVAPDGSFWAARVVSLKPLVFEAAARLTEGGRHPLTILTALPQPNRASFLVEKCTEIGVGRIAPLLCERSVHAPRSPANLVERWSRVAVAAVKQSGSPLPEILAPVPFAEALERFRPLVMLHPGAGERLADLLARRDGPLAVMIGPEGGFTEAEAEAAREAGAETCSLGPGVLRIETAAVVCAALFAARKGKR